MKNYLAIDIGGTAIKYAFMNEKAELLEKGELKTPYESLDQFVETIGSIYDKYADKIEGLAMSAPGRIDAKTGYMFTGGSIPYIRETPMVQILAERCPTRITIDNDGKCAALAELWLGSLKGIEHGVVLTIGTGIGGGIIVNGKLLRGYNFAAGEVSALPTSIVATEPLNFWRNINNTKALTRKMTISKGIDTNNITGRDFFEAIKQKDNEALNILDEFCENFARALFSVQSVLDSQRVAIGGGISAQDVLIETIRKKVDELFFDQRDKPQQKMEIVRCQFGNDSNLIGALYHHLYE